MQNCVVQGDFRPLGGPGDALEKVDVGVRTFTDGDELRSQDVFARDADASFAAEFELIQPGADGTGERRVCDRLLVLLLLSSNSSSLVPTEQVSAASVIACWYSFRAFL